MFDTFPSDVVSPFHNGVQWSSIGNVHHIYCRLLDTLWGHSVGKHESELVRCDCFCVWMAASYDCEVSIAKVSVVTVLDVHSNTRAVWWTPRVFYVWHEFYESVHSRVALIHMILIKLARFRVGNTPHVRIRRAHSRTGRALSILLLHGARIEGFGTIRAARWERS